MHLSLEPAKYTFKGFEKFASLVTGTEMCAVINIKASMAAPWEKLSSKPETNAVDQRPDSTFLISFALVTTSRRLIR